jgi:hypothetical protein
VAALSGSDVRAVGSYRAIGEFDPDHTLIERYCP